jgi:hypothetical protein
LRGYLRGEAGRGSAAGGQRGEGANWRHCEAHAQPAANLEALPHDTDSKSFHFWTRGKPILLAILKHEGLPQCMVRVKQCLLGNLYGVFIAGNGARAPLDERDTKRHREYLPRSPALPDIRGAMV